jgi:hypothetical protein
MNRLRLAPAVLGLVGMLLLITCGQAQTVLAPGELAIIQYRTSKGDSFSFVNLVDMAPGTKVHFTDKGWTGSGFPRWENVWTYEAPPGGLAKGKVVQMDVGNGLSNKHGDQVIAFQGTVAQPRFIYALSTRPWITQGQIDHATSYLPAGLVNGETALDFPSHEKHGSFNITRAGGTPGQISRRVSKPAHWQRSHDFRDLFRDPSAWFFKVAPPPVKPLRIGIASTTTPLIRLEPRHFGFLSVMKSDPGDPAGTLGIDMGIVGANRRQLSVTATHAPEAGKPYAPPDLELTGNGALRNLRIKPSARGFARITVSASDGSHSSKYELLYASATRPDTIRPTMHHTGASDASAVVSAGPRHMLVADDEDQIIRLYERFRSGAPLATYNVDPYLDLPEFNDGAPREVDIEGAAEVGRRVYWIGSHGNSRLGEACPNRRRVFSTDRHGLGLDTRLKFIGHYDGLREDLLQWDRENGHGLGISYLGLAASARAADVGGVEPKRPDGFNIESLAMQPDSQTDMYIGFRAPLVPPTDRRFALVVPVSNMTAIVDASAKPGSARFGAPILLDLEGRGIRAMARNASNEYLIVAGPQTSSADPANDFLLYTWDGRPESSPHKCRIDLAAAGLLGNIEGILKVPPANPDFCHVVIDQGAHDWYGDGLPAKIQVAPLRQFTGGILEFTADFIPEMQVSEK